MKSQYTIYIDFGDGLGFQDMSALGVVRGIQSTSINREKDNMYFRLQLGEITFQNVAAYDFYQKIENVDFLTEMKVRLVYNSLVINGYFARIDCIYDYDLNAKIIKAKPSIDDNYRYFLENHEREISLEGVDFEYQTFTTKLINSRLKTSFAWGVDAQNQPIGGAMTIGWSTWYTLTTDGVVDFSGFFDLETSAPNLERLALSPTVPKAGSPLTSLSEIIETKATRGWELSELTVYYVSTSLTNGRVTCAVIATFSRESEFVPTSDGTADGEMVEPIGGSDAGWQVDYISTIQSPTRLGIWGYTFFRVPYNGAYSTNWELGSVVTRDSTMGTESFPWASKRTTKINYPLTEEDEGVFEIQGAFGLKHLLTELYRKIDPIFETKEVKSLFFFNDNEADYDFMVGNEGANYVTNLPNELNYLNVIRTISLRTIIDENSEDFDFKLSMKKLIEDLQRLFPIKYRIDDDLNLWLEHIKFYEIAKAPINLVGRCELINTYQYSFDSSDAVAEKKYSQKNAGYSDFTKNIVTFDQSVTNKRNRDSAIQVATELFTTDLRFCIENPNDLENGLILVLAKDGAVINDVGFISGSEVQNGALCLSQLLMKYWRYEGVWFSGEINETPVVFVNTIRSKLGIELSYNKIEPNLFYTTQIGSGLINDGTIDFDNETTSLKLRYRFTSNEIGDNAWYLVTKLNSLYDFENTEQ